MKLNVNKSHKKATMKPKNHLKKNITLLIMGAVIGIGVYSGCSKMISHDNPDYEASNKIAEVTSNDENVIVSYNEDKNNYEVERDGEVITIAALSSLCSSLATLGISQAAFYHSMKKHEEAKKAALKTTIYNFDYSSTLEDTGRRRRR